MPGCLWSPHEPSTCQLKSMDNLQISDNSAEGLATSHYNSSRAGWAVVRLDRAMFHCQHELQIILLPVSISVIVADAAGPSQMHMCSPNASGTGELCSRFGKGVVSGLFQQHVSMTLVSNARPMKIALQSTATWPHRLACPSRAARQIEVEAMQQRHSV